MKEKILRTKKNGMLVLGLTILVLIAALAVTIAGCVMLDSEEGNVIGIIMAVCGGLLLCIGWIPLIGLKVIRPEEALVLTLFGKYVKELKFISICNIKFGINC